MAADGPEVAVGAVVVHDGCLLLVSRGRPPGEGRWSVPGGRVRRGEVLQEAVVREVAEETGVDVVVDRFLGHVERLDPPAGEHFLILDYAAVPTRPDPAPVAGGDAADARWVPLAEVPELDLVEGLFDFLVEHGVVPAARTFEL